MDDLTKVVYPLSCWLIAVYVTISIVVTYHHFNAVHLMSYDIVAVFHVHQWHGLPLDAKRQNEKNQKNECHNNGNVYKRKHVKPHSKLTMRIASASLLSLG